MKYKLRIRKIEESDLSVNCPFMPDEDSFEMYLTALIEDIQNLDVVISLSQYSDYLIVEIESNEDFPVLHSLVRNLLENQFNDKLKTVSGFQVVQ